MEVRSVRFSRDCKEECRARSNKQKRNKKGNKKGKKMDSTSGATAFYEALKKEEQHDRLMTIVGSKKSSYLMLGQFFEQLGITADSVDQGLRLFRSRHATLPYAHLPFEAKRWLTDLALLNPHFRLNPDASIHTTSTTSDVPAPPINSPDWKFALHSVLVQLSEMAKKRGLNGQDFELQAGYFLDTSVGGYNEMIQQFVETVERHHRLNEASEVGSGSGSMLLEDESALVGFHAFLGYATNSGMSQEESQKLYEKIFRRFM